MSAGAPGRGHLAGDDTADVVLEPQHVDGVAPVGAGHRDQSPPVADLAGRGHQHHRSAAGGEPRPRAHRAVLAPADRAALRRTTLEDRTRRRRRDPPLVGHAGGQRCGSPGAVEQRQAGLVPHDEVGRGVGGDEDPHLTVGVACVGAGVVEVEDLAPGESGLGGSAGAVLAHPVAVAPAVAAQHDPGPLRDRHQVGAVPLTGRHLLQDGLVAPWHRLRRPGSAGEERERHEKPRGAGHPSPIGSELLRCRRPGGP